MRGARVHEVRRVREVPRRADVKYRGASEGLCNMIPSFVSGASGFSLMQIRTFAVQSYVPSWWFVSFLVLRPIAPYCTPK